MKINHSNVSYSSIVGIGEKIKATGEDFLLLNRGINSVVNIDLGDVIKNIDFNSTALQAYAPNRGLDSLRSQIGHEYFEDSKLSKNISITPGGMPALDMIFQILNPTRFYFPKFYWGSYAKVADIRKQKIDHYDDIFEQKFEIGSVVIICTPSNPTGISLNYDDLILRIRELDKMGVVVIFDSPYLNLFEISDHLRFSVHGIFEQLKSLKNVIITESFSKSLGLSGLRIGFIYSCDDEFNDELNKRLLYSFNGVSTFPQLLVRELMASSYGIMATNIFKEKTVSDITKNILWLFKNGLLAHEIYGSESNITLPVGIFAIINKTEKDLFYHKIGSVGLEKFTHVDKDRWRHLSRICVSVPHEKFVVGMSSIL